MTTGIGLIENERMRQVLQEGWTAEHDDKHTGGEMAPSHYWNVKTGKECGLPSKAGITPECPCYEHSGLSVSEYAKLVKFLDAGQRVRIVRGEVYGPGEKVRGNHGKSRR